MAAPEVDVPPKLSARARIFVTGQGRKTDAIDAHFVALVGARMSGPRPPPSTVTPMTEDRDGQSTDSHALLVIAKQFRDAASDAGRQDVVAKIDEAIILLASADPAANRADRGSDKSTIVLQIFDGLGF